MRLQKALYQDIVKSPYELPGNDEKINLVENNNDKKIKLLKFKDNKV